MTCLLVQVVAINFSTCNPSDMSGLRTASEFQFDESGTSCRCPYCQLDFAPDESLLKQRTDGNKAIAEGIAAALEAKQMAIWMVIIGLPIQVIVYFFLANVGTAEEIPTVLFTMWSMFGLPILLSCLIGQVLGLRLQSEPFWRLNMLALVSNLFSVSTISGGFIYSVIELQPSALKYSLVFAGGMLGLGFLFHIFALRQLAAQSGRSFSLNSTIFLIVGFVFWPLQKWAIAMLIRYYNDHAWDGLLDFRDILRWRNPQPKPATYHEMVPPAILLLLLIEVVFFLRWLSLTGKAQEALTNPSAK